MYTEGMTEQVWTSQHSIQREPVPIHNPCRLAHLYVKHDKVHVLYLHTPEHSVPFEDTVHEINKFEIFGLSNFTAWEVFVGICKTNSYVLPKIYQVMYNAITHEIEPELVSCCRKYNIRLVIYNPLVGGLFAGKVNSVKEQAPEGNVPCYYLQEGYFEPLELLKAIAEKHNLHPTKIALRWCQHHSRLDGSDGIILSASNTAQVKQNCKDSAKGPLPQEVVDALDKACSTYIRSVT
ncbi:NADP-dependent oxidoreductase domain containing protein [Tylopilus felleus]